MVATPADEDELLPKLRDARSTLTSLLSSASGVERSLAGVDTRLSLSLDATDAAAEAVALIQSQAISNKALHARINRVIPPALDALRSFSIAESLQRRLLLLSSNFDAGRPDPQLHLSRLLNYIDTVNRFRDAIASVNSDCEPAVQRLQEAVEFLTRTKATDNRRLNSLRETLARLKSIYANEVDASRFESLLDQALLRLQDDFESILLQLHHHIYSDKEECSGLWIEHRRDEMGGAGDVDRPVDRESGTGSGDSARGGEEALLRGAGRCDGRWRRRLDGVLRQDGRQDPGRLRQPSGRPAVREGKGRVAKRRGRPAPAVRKRRDRRRRRGGGEPGADRRGGGDRV